LLAPLSGRRLAVAQQQQRNESVCGVIKQVVETTTTEVGAVRYHYENKQIEYQMAMVRVLLLYRAVLLSVLLL